MEVCIAWWRRAFQESHHRAKKCGSASNESPDDCVRLFSRVRSVDPTSPPKLPSHSANLSKQSSETNVLKESSSAGEMWGCSLAPETQAFVTATAAAAATVAATLQQRQKTVKCAGGGGGRRRRVVEKTGLVVSIASHEQHRKTDNDQR